VCRSQSPNDRYFATELVTYANYYEIDFPMWFLAVLGKAVTTGRVEPTAFGGPASKIAQGSLIDSAVRALSGTPLERPMAKAYDPELRNAIQHNNYKLIGPYTPRRHPAITALSA
jgi:hypothetical protein